MTRTTNRRPEQPATHLERVSRHDPAVAAKIKATAWVLGIAAAVFYFGYIAWYALPAAGH